MQSAIHFLEWQIVSPNFDAMPMRRYRGDECIKDLSQHKSLASKLACVGRRQGPIVVCRQIGTWLWPSVCLTAWSIREFGEFLLSFYYDQKNEHKLLHCYTFRHYNVILRAACNQYLANLHEYFKCSCW
jgi:hypothetical protein